MTDFFDSSKEKIAKDIIDARGDIWLVWSLGEKGIVSVRGICTEQRFANAYRKALKNHPTLIRVWVEKTITNHLYGEGTFESVLYGNGPIKFKDFDKIQNKTEPS